jgi:threonylcarbamoyladenosine tRNA methylthiotransferase MtaB
MSENGPRIRVGEIGKGKEIVRPAAASFPGHTRAFLKIQDGCDASCSYCIVPHVRGGSRSIPPEEVLERISSLGGADFREVVLTGIHLGAYGRDLQPAADLTSLVRRIAEGSPVERFRLSSIEPREVTDELLALIGNSSGRICRHLHIPLQSGDDAILAAMNRDYDGDFFRGLIEKIHRAVPGIAVGIDVMAGFPGETEAAFESTVCLVEKLPAAYLHVFPFSRRPGTPAASMPDQVSEEEKKRRTQRLRALGAAKRRAFAERFLGKTLEVLVEERQDRETRHLVGFSDNYIPVAVRGDVSANRIVRVRPEAFRNGRLIAEALPERGISSAQILPSEADE